MWGCFWDVQLYLIHFIELCQNIACSWPSDRMNINMLQYPLHNYMVSSYLLLWKEPGTNKVSNNFSIYFSFCCRFILNGRSLWFSWNKFFPHLSHAFSLMCWWIPGLGWAGQKCHVQLWHSVLMSIISLQSHCCRYWFLRFLSKFVHKLVKAFVITNWVTTLGTDVVNWKWMMISYGQCSIFDTHLLLWLLTEYREAIPRFLHIWSE